MNNPYDFIIKAAQAQSVSKTAVDVFIKQQQIAETAAKAFNMATYIAKATKRSNELYEIINRNAKATMIIHAAFAPFRGVVTREPSDSVTTGRRSVCQGEQIETEFSYDWKPKAGTLAPKQGGRIGFRRQNEND